MGCKFDPWSGAKIPYGESSAGAHHTGKWSSVISGKSRGVFARVGEHVVALPGLQQGTLLSPIHQPSTLVTADGYFFSSSAEDPEPSRS